MPSYYALAATYAYRAYHVESMLDMAVHLWQNVSQYQISMSQAVTGKHPLKPNYTFSSTCLSSRSQPSHSFRAYHLPTHHMRRLCNRCSLRSEHVASRTWLRADSCDLLTQDFAPDSFVFNTDATGYEFTMLISDSMLTKKESVEA
jgi:hypothetical protein